MSSGKIAISGGLGIMRQFVGSLRDESNVRDLLLSVAPPKIREAAQKLKDTEAVIDESEKSQMNFSKIKYKKCYIHINILKQETRTKLNIF